MGASQSVKRSVMSGGNLAAAAVAGLALGLGYPAAAEGVKWESLTIQEALTKAAQTGSLIMVDVYASHCQQCQVMDEELWQTPEGAELAEGLLAVRFPSDKPEGIELQRRYPVLGLPLVIFLNPDGTELDRIVGYRDRNAWLIEARSLKAGADPLPGLEKELAAKPDFGPLVYAVFERYVFRNRIDEAEALLERLIKLDPERKGGRSTMALTQFAKYHDYFRHDVARAQFIYRTIVEEYPATSGVTGALQETFEYHEAQGTLAEWLAWVCPIALSHPQALELNRYTARFALGKGLTGDCLGQAARNAALLEKDARQKAFMDSIAVVLDGPRR